MTRMLRAAMAAGLGGACAGLAACAPDIGELEDLPSLDAVAVAQFDPTNPVPQLRLTPSPTVLAESTVLVDGQPVQVIDQDAVAPAPCELPDAAQCLAFVDGGWPIDLFPTLNFSAPLVEGSTAEGFLLFAVRPGGQLEPVPFEATQSPRPLPKDACKDGDNGSEPYRTFDDADVAQAWGTEPYDVELRPLGPDGAPTTFEHGTQYVVAATTRLRAQPAEMGGSERPVEASALFYLLNTDTAPVVASEVDGATVYEIVDPLLRSNVVGGLLETYFDGRSVDELSADEQAELATRVNGSAASLLGLYELVDGLAQLLLANGQLGDRSDLLIVNTWTTGREMRTPTEVVFDPLDTVFPTDVRFPFPNDALLTVPTSSTATGVQVAFPDLPEGTSATLVGLVEGLETLDGFGLTSPIALQTSRELDPSTLSDNVRMLELDADGVPTGVEPAIAAVATASSAEFPTPQLIIQPLDPLTPGTRYAVGITSGVRDLAGEPVVSGSVYELLKTPAPLVQDGEVPSPAKEALQCSALQETGSFPDDAVLVGTASALENDLARPRWQEAFQAFESLEPPVPRTELAMAFTYTTQTLTPTVDLVKSALAAYEALPPMDAPVLPTATDVMEPDANSTVIADQVIDVGNNLCLPICQSGALAPAIPADQCEVGGSVNPAVLTTPPCQLLRGLLGSAIGRARLHLLRTYDLTEGNPFATGTFTPARIQMPRVDYVPFWVLTPRGTPPAAGWPVVVFQHGLTVSKETGLLVANTLAAAGWATVSMDLPFHGQRASDIVDENGFPDLGIDPDEVDCDLETGDCTGGNDGTRDPSGTGFVSPNIFGTRDNLRQAVVDHLTLLRSIESESSPGSALDDLDPTQIGVLGQSMGGVAAGNLAAYVGPDDIEAFVLNAAGGNLLEILVNTVPSIGSALFAGLAQAGVCELVDPLDPSAGCRDTPLWRTFQLVAQWVLEPGDPRANATAVLASLPMRGPSYGADRILMQISQPDPVLTNTASQQLAAALGFDLVGGDDRYQVYDFSNLPASSETFGCHGFLVDPRCGECFEAALCNTFGAQSQAATFIATRGATIQGQTAVAIPGIDCANPCP